MLIKITGQLLDLDYDYRKPPKFEYDYRLLLLSRLVDYQSCSFCKEASGPKKAQGWLELGFDRDKFDFDPDQFDSIRCRIIELQAISAILTPFWATFALFDVKMPQKEPVRPQIALKTIQKGAFWVKKSTFFLGMGSFSQLTPSDSI